MVRLIGEVAGIRGGHAEKKRFLMNGLCGLVCADAWVWGLSCQRDPQKPQVYVSLLNAGIPDSKMPQLIAAVEHPAMIPLTAKFHDEVGQKKQHITRSRFQITNPAAFAASPARAAWEAADIGPTILSIRPLDERSSSGIALYRRYRREEFTDREVLIAHVILTEVSWLHEQGWPEDRGVSVPTLPRRQRLTLNLLILGHSRKQIAGEMKISMNTVQGYIKEIYSYFKVNSQAELMNRFFQGSREERNVSTTAN
jgi:DNA-binding CsgD family transcriptional regulator